MVVIPLSRMLEPEPDVTSTVFDRMHLDDENCFLCGKRFAGDSTREHVFPKWLQHRHDLWGQQLVLFNRTLIPYSQLTIPCCQECNNDHLGVLENRIKTAVEAGYSEACKLSSLEIYQWLGKIFYGILRKEITLLLDRRDADAGTIIPPSFLESYSTLHLFLQSITQPFQFPSGEPFTALIVNLHYEDGDNDYFFRDNLPLATVSLRTKDVGFIVTLEDAGLINDTYGKYVTEVNGRSLVDIQFDELYAKCLYQVSLLTHAPRFITVANDDPSVPTSVDLLPFRGVGEWNPADFAVCLRSIIEPTYPQVDCEILYESPDKVSTWLNDVNGNLSFFGPTNP